MRIIKIGPQEYDLVCHWWASQDRAIILKAALPDTGLMVLGNDEVPLAAGWIYNSNSNMGFLGWSTTNPKAKPKDRASALKLLESTACALAPEMGISVLCAFSGGGGWSRILKKRGWVDSMVKHDFLLKGV
jgi:hypothetical protein